jgi:hypothetical protein
MTTNAHLNLDVEGKPVDQSLYHFLIGHLLYLTASRPDFMFGVCLCAQILFYEAISFGLMLNLVVYLSFMTIKCDTRHKKCHVI